MKLTTLIFCIFVIGFVSLSVFVFKPSSPVTTFANPVASASTSSVCVITIDNQKYDVTTFRSQHSGGDVFNCGTDMTQVFYSQHGQRELQKMSRYKVQN